MITIKIDRLAMMELEEVRDFINTALSYNYNLDPYSNTLDVEIAFGRLEESIAFLTAIENARFARS